MSSRALVTSYEGFLERFPDVWQRRGLVLAAGATAVFPFVADAYWLSVGNLALIAIVGATGLMILTGFAGQISLGHAAFLALGAYSAAVGARAGLPFWLLLPAGGLVAALVGLTVGPFALRLRGLYLAIVTLGLLFIVDHALLAMPGLTGGVAGTPVPMHVWFVATEGGATASTPWTAGFLTLTFGQRLYFLFLLLGIGALLAASNLTRSRLGRAMMAVRDHDLAAAAMGVDQARTKITAFGISSFFGGVAGAMFGFQQQFITVDPPFNLMMSIQYVAMIVLGGAGSVFGAAAGPLCFAFLTPAAEQVGDLLPFAAELSSAERANVLFALLVSAFLIFEPLGLYGIWLRVKRYFQTWPFSY